MENEHSGAKNGAKCAINNVWLHDHLNGKHKIFFFTPFGATPFKKNLKNVDFSLCVANSSASLNCTFFGF